MSGFKRYPAYKESGVEWIGEIPSGWSHKMLKFVGNAVLGKMLTNDDKGDYSLKSYLRAKNILWERVDADDINEMWFSAREMEQFRVRTNDLLISEGGEVGRTAIWNDELEECYLQNSVHKFTVGKGEEPRFHLYQFVVLGKLGYFDSVVNKVSIGHLTGEKLGPIPLVTPPPSEQTKIAAFLDRKTAQIDRLIEIKRRQIEVLKEERTAVINQAVTKGLHPGVKMKESGIEWIGEIPEGWQVKRVKFLAEEGSGIQMGPFGSMLCKLPIGPSGYKLYGQENTISGNFSSGNRWLEPGRFRELEKYIMEEGDIVLTRKGSIGNCRLVPEGIMPGVIDSDTIRVRVNDNLISSRFFVLLLHDAWYVQSQILRNCRGAILSGLNTSTISELFIICPPRAEQTEIEAFLGNELIKIANLENTAKKTIQLLQEYRTTLISDAVTGKIDVREEAA